MGTLTLTGFAAYLLLWAAVLSGVAVAAPRRGRAGLRLFGARRHEGLSLAALSFGFLHAAEALSRRFGGVRWGVLVRSGPEIQFGVVALVLALVVTISFYLRGRLPGRSWRWLHPLAYAAFGFALWHGLAAGANAWLPAVRLMYVLTGGSALVAGLTRLGGLRQVRAKV